MSAQRRNGNYKNGIFRTEKYNISTKKNSLHGLKSRLKTAETELTNVKTSQQKLPNLKNRAKRFKKTEQS